MSVFCVKPLLDFIRVTLKGHLFESVHVHW